jgi:GTP-binding protein YchF
MKIAITGFQNSGKTTVFNALTGLNFLTTPYPSVMEEPNIGIIKVPDKRVEHLTSIFQPRKTTLSTIEYIDYHGLIQGNSEHNRKVFDLIQGADAVVEVVRVFDDESIAHPDGGIDPKRDAADIKMEFLFFDLELVEKRLSRMEESARRGQPVDAREKDVIEKCGDALEREVMLRDVEFSVEEMDAIKHLQFLTMKPGMVLLNISEKDLGKVEADNIVNAVAQRKNGRTDDVVQLSAKIETEIAQLARDEALEFMADLGIAEPALNRLIRLSYGKVGLIYFLTVGSDEVRAWTIREGTIARKAGGKIHSDIERGFIRAETVSYDDFVSAGSLAGVRKKGLFRLEGKSYEVKDGDIIDFRFNVS